MVHIDWKQGRSLSAIVLSLAFLWVGERAVRADEARLVATENWAVHAELTFVEQFHPSFTSPYRGANSLNPGNRGDETVAADLLFGARPWKGAEIWADPQIDQGFGLSNTLGIAAFPSGEAYKVGSPIPYFRLQRLFVRQNVDLGGDEEEDKAGAMQLAGAHRADHITFTAGKIAVVDIFDTNDYAHDPSRDFMNWAVIDAGAFDYAADSWGFTYGGAMEWTKDWWTLRGGIFDLSKIPNGKHLETGFRQFELLAEGEERHNWMGRDGKLKLLVFMNRGWMGAYNEAVALAERTGTIPSTALVRNYRSRPGATLNFQQEIADDLGVFARLSYNDGSQEAYEFTEINRGLSGGVSLKGTEWDRKDDTVGAAYFVDGISSTAQDYFGHGGLGILIGDGRLPNYRLENGIETFYSAQITDWFAASADYQLVVNPAYNPDRGPVSIFSARLHAEF